MGTIPGVLRALLSPGAVLFQREVHNFQTEINECLCTLGAVVSAQGLV